jgi:hypothetical protein
LQVEVIEKVNVEVEACCRTTQACSTAKSRMRRKVNVMMLGQRVVKMQPAGISSGAMQQQWAAFAAPD